MAHDTDSPAAPAFGAQRFLRQPMISVTSAVATTMSAASGSATPTHSGALN